ncbi:MAG TPA: hypothetical protein P5571_15285 [Candidatus Krumholzibacteria bacterium]|nr:hypothetical protein [Candidatus Krumholzibacteria bacterium]HRX52732.1 hypothetical protein [Candidatus Krumholzibacteria bacterium]
MKEQHEHGLECVDPDVGARILDLTLPIVEADDRRLLEAHAEVCAACRLTLGLHAELQTSYSEFSATVAVTGRRTLRATAFAGWAAMTALAAGLALAMLLPPRAVGPHLDLRGAEAPRILRPVEGEVVAGDHVTLRWTPVPGAERYDVRLTDPDGGLLWSGTTADADLSLPVADATGRARVLIATEPRDLLPAGTLNVAFRTGDAGDALRHRIRHAGPLPAGLWLGGVLLGAFAALRRKG